jgi:outer membrane protein assembly factor BamB
MLAALFGVFSPSVSAAAPEAARGPGWVRPERDELRAVLGLRHVVRVDEPPFMALYPQQWAPPCITADRSLVVVAAASGVLHALELETGQPRWARRDLGQLGLGCGRDTTRVFVGAEGRVFALDAASGRTEWSTDVGGMVGGPITVVGSVAVVPVRPNNYVAVDPTNGEVRWRLRRGKSDAISVRGQAPATVDVPRRLAFLGNADGSVQAVALDSGELRWTQRLSGVRADDPFPDVDAQPVLDASGYLWVASYNAGLFALDPSNGEIRRRVEAVKHVTGLREIPHAGVLVASIGDGQVVGVHAASGLVRWRYRMKKAVPTAPEVIEGGRVVVGSGRGGLVVLDPLDGRPRQIAVGTAALQARLATDGKDLIALSSRGHVLFLRVGEGFGVSGARPHDRAPDLHF